MTATCTKFWPLIGNIECWSVVMGKILGKYIEGILRRHERKNFSLTPHIFPIGRVSWVAEIYFPKRPPKRTCPSKILAPQLNGKQGGKC